MERTIGSESSRYDLPEEAPMKLTGWRLLATWALAIVGGWGLVLAIIYGVVSVVSVVFGARL